VRGGAFTTWGTLGFGKTLTYACAAYKVDLQKIEQATRATLSAKKSAQ
jgi:hypothetical protein